MLKGAIFDQDGILFDTEAIYQVCWRKVAREMGSEVLEGFTEKISGSTKEGTIKAIRDYVPGVDPYEYKERAVAMAHAMQDENLPLKPGVKEMLEFFKKRHMPMAVASSSRSVRVRKNLEKAGFIDYFDEIITGNDVENGKPAPDIFLLAAKRLGLKPEECYVFEDSYNGVRAGKRAGCYTIMIPDLIAPDSEMENTYSACYKDFFEVMENLK